MSFLGLLTGVALLATPVNAVAKSHLTPTGITAEQCYQSDSAYFVKCDTDGAIALSGAGKQDGMRAGKLSYSKVGNYALEECVQDNITGLMWEGKMPAGSNSPRASDRTFTQYGDKREGDASAYVEQVNREGLCGFKDWRMPTKHELQSIVDYSKSYPGPVVDTVWLVNTASRGYWAADPTVDYPYHSWCVYFEYGYVDSYRRSHGFAVRLVRGG